MSQRTAQIVLAILCIVLVVGAVQSVQNWDARRQAAPNQSLDELYGLWLHNFDAAEAVPLLEGYLATGDRDALMAGQRVLLRQTNHASSGFTLYFGARHDVRLERDHHPRLMFTYAMVILDRILQPDRYDEPLSADDERMIVETIIEELTLFQEQLNFGMRHRLLRNAEFIKSMARRSIPVLEELAEDVGVTLPQPAG